MVTFPSPIPGIAGKTVIDWAGAPFLVLAGFFGIWAWLRLRRRRAGATYWLAVGLGLIYLAFDDIIGVHERIGRGVWTQGDHIPLGFKHFDDVIVLGYGLGGLLLTARFLGELLRHRAVAMPFGMALVASAVGVAFDATNPLDDYTQFVEEPAELLAALSFAFALSRCYRLAIGESADRPAIAEPAVALEAAPLPALAAAEGDARVG